MISVSSDYKNYISNNLSVSAKNKIIVDGVEYLGNVLKTYPKISHSTSKICGSFPAKTVSFEIYDLNNSLDFENKEIEVYKGLMLNGTPYYVKQGVFIPQKKDITTNISNRTIKFENVEDKTQYLEDVYESELDWSNDQTHTGLEIVQEICNKKNLTLKNTNFGFASYSFKQPNFPSNITYRQVLSRLAEIAGEIVIFDSEGLLEIKAQYDTGDTIDRSRYEKISKEKTITFNSVVLGKAGINDDIKYPNDMPDDERVSFRIEDNPFVDLYREEMIEEVASKIIGLSYTPFVLNNTLDGFIYELNDVISVVDRNDEILRAVIIDICNISRIKSNLKLDTDIKDTTDYNLAGSNKESLSKVRLDVDHINNKINSVVSATDTMRGIIIGTYSLTEDETFQADKTYYILNDVGDYVEYTNYEVGDTIPEDTIYELTGSIVERVDENNSNLQEQINNNANAIQNLRQQTTSQFEQTTNSFEASITSVTQTINDNQDSTNQKFDDIKNYLRYEEVNGVGIVTLGVSNSEIVLKQRNDRVYFEQNGNEVAYISNNKLYITDAQFLNSIQIGNFAFIPRSNGSLGFRKVA